MVNNNNVTDYKQAVAEFLSLHVLVSGLGRFGRGGQFVCSHVVQEPALLFEHLQ